MKRKKTQNNKKKNHTHKESNQSKENSQEKQDGKRLEGEDQMMRGECGNINKKSKQTKNIKVKT